MVEIATFVIDGDLGRKNYGSHTNMIMDNV